MYRLLAYGFVWLFAHQTRETLADGSQTERWAPYDVTLVLAVPAINKALRDELGALGLVLPALTTGYYEVTGELLPLLVIDLGAVAEGEDDDLLRWFSGRSPRTVEARRWVRQHTGDGDAMSLNATPDLDGWDEWVQQFVSSLTLEQRLAGLTPEQRLAGLKPEETLATLAPEHVVLALPIEALRGLSSDYVATLPAEVQAAIRTRLGH